MAIDHNRYDPDGGAPHSESADLRRALTIILLTMLHLQSI